MRDRPILFSGPMVRAMLAGDKTQTRREVTPHNIRLWMGEEVGSVKPAAELLAIAFEEAAEFRSLDGAQAWTAKARDYQNADRTNWQARSTYGFAGDFLWVRETLRRTAEGDWTYDIGGDVIAMPAFDPRVPEMIAWAHHKADAHCVSIHMPRWANRLTLRLNDLRIERLHDISEADAIAEGVVPAATYGGKTKTWLPTPEDRSKFYPSAREAYFALWRSIDGAASFDANPWVWVLDFKQHVFVAHVDKVLEGYRSAA